MSTNKRVLRFIVQGQAVRLDPACDFSGLVAGSVGYLHAEFQLDSAWNGCKVAASFWRGGREYAVLLRSGACLIPAEAVTGKLVGVSLTGVRQGYRLTTNRIYIEQEVQANGNG